MLTSPPLAPANRRAGSAQRVRLGRWLTALSVIGIAMMTLLPNATNVTTAALCVVCGPLGGVDALLNVALFVPLGIGLALARAPLWLALLVIGGYSGLIELLQVNWIAGRDASVGDVVTNSIGGSLGIILGRNAGILLRAEARLATRLTLAWLVFWVTAQAVIAYAYVPNMPPPPYYAQVARPATPWRGAFPGQVLSARVGDEPLAPGELQNASILRALLARPDGSRSEASVIAVGSTRQRSEIVVVSGPGMVGVLSLEQVGSDFLFAVRTGAEVLRLRSVEFRVRSVFPSAATRETADTLTLHGRYGLRLVSAGASRGRTERRMEFVPRLSYGWVLISPFHTFIDGDALEYVASVAFTALLLLPAGYWSRFTRAGDTGMPAGVSVMLAAAVGAGFVVIPSLFGLRPVAVWEWAALIGGAVTGWLAAGLGARQSSDLTDPRPGVGEGAQNPSPAH